MRGLGSASNIDKIEGNKTQVFFFCNNFFCDEYFAIKLFKTIIHGLEPDEEYHILLTAFNHCNKYKNAEYLAVRTAGIPPSKPQRLVFEVSSAERLQISWGEPEFLNGILKGYILEYYPIDLPNQVRKSVLKKMGHFEWR